ncbi:MAG TPA: helix-turn-helix transcriptional regulator [Saccharofermentans sp.]|nr:helix-turn-helix transcriptional regulator [Saccharofermentans sp.]
MSLMHIFAINIKKYRTEQKLSQEKLAELSGLHRTYISAIEREQRNISIENIENIASALNIDAYKLFITDNNTN